MKRRIVAYKNYYKDFFESLDAGTQEKILYGMLLLKTQERLPSKFVKAIRDGLYELRIMNYESNGREISIGSSFVSIKDKWWCFSIAFRKRARKRHRRKLIKHLN